MIEIKRIKITKSDDCDTNPLYEKTYESELSEVIYNEEELIEYLKQEMVLGFNWEAFEELLLEDLKRHT